MAVPAAAAIFSFPTEKRLVEWGWGWGWSGSSSSLVSWPSIRSQPNPLRADGDGRPLTTNTELFSLSVGAHLIPHPRKVDKGGEDAFLVSSHNGGVIAVADGVSGWAERNVDPSLFSKELMASALSFVADDEVNFDPRMLLKKAHAAIRSVGSATVTIAMLQTDGVLKVANLGDCGLKIIRRGLIIFSTTPQEHYFDCPFQLSSETLSQTSLDAVLSTVQLMEKDIIVMGSDGLFDNVFDKEITSTVAECEDVSEAAKALAELARTHSMDLAFDSPYSMEARSRGFDVPFWKKLVGIRLTGGKLDDITVVVGRVVKMLNSLEGMADMD
ncbi:hypothetical protein MLD38_040085 [Melastoma candidum]|uniref:Uncharacterized protein n=1 Tax=Melastoma candidum TaxID=119954 RepID=A0ACB9L451_9MYRT|nr:hypothetical protein MLD38_040085 [Melastoma candidum]